MSSRVALCPGSFDPVTLGHLDIVARARTMFDEVVVAVGVNASKTALLDADTRVALLAAAVADMDGVRVVPMSGLLADLGRELGATAIVKGLRGGADYDVEQPMALMNRHLCGIETIFVTGDPALAHIASSMVRDIARHGGPIADLVPAGVTDVVAAALSNHGESR